MRQEGRRFLLDADILIAAHRRYYSFDICPGFWRAIREGHSAERVFSTRRVRKQLMDGGDGLATWVGEELPEDFFIDDETATVAARFAPMMAWVGGHHFHPAAKALFASDTDGWLVAAAKDRGWCVVTNETYQPEVKARVKIPNVCVEFGVEYIDTFDFLRELECRFQ